MASKQEQLIETAERLFYQEGFHATGIDRVIATAGVARMTLYKHFPSKDALVHAVLDRRDRRYWSRITEAVESARTSGGSPALAVFAAHSAWLIQEGHRGCMFMKAIGEYAEHVPEIADAAAAHKRRLLRFMRELLKEAGGDTTNRLEVPLVMLLEGATALAQILPPDQVASQAENAARRLLAIPETS